MVISSVAVNEETFGNNSHFVVNCIVRNKNSPHINALALIDSGAAAYEFIDTKFAQVHNLKTIPLSKPRSLKVFDATESASG